MKNKKKIILICFMCLFIFVVGCSGDTDKDKKDNKDELPNNKIESTETTESTETQKTTEENIVSYEEVYIEELNNSKASMSMYNPSITESDNKDSEVCITDLVGDDTPEIMYIYFNQSEEKEYLRIVGCDNGVKKIIYDEAIDITPWGDTQYFFKTNDGKLHYYIGYGDNEYHDMYCTFEENSDGTLTIKDTVLMASWLDPMEDIMCYKYTMNDVEISEEEYKTNEQSLLTNVVEICLYDRSGLDVLKGKVSSYTETSMGCDEAITYLNRTLEE